MGAVNTVMVESGLMSRERLVEVMSVTPRRLLGMETELREGATADLTLVDFDREWTVDPSEFVSMGHSTPFEGMQLKGDAVMTIFRGRIVHDSLKPAAEV
ncbi:MAG: amidohydrolase family protein [Muribaculaceae bacterium]|nr:amidohydrolase family protein [Muribaculaceae bacterium]